LARLAAAEGWDPAVMRINPKDKREYMDEIRSAVFCLAPYGNGCGWTGVPQTDPAVRIASCLG
jgi:hypothetical protein